MPGFALVVQLRMISKFLAAVPNFSDKWGSMPLFKSIVVGVRQLNSFTESFPTLAISCDDSIKVALYSIL